MMMWLKKTSAIKLPFTKVYRVMKVQVFRLFRSGERLACRVRFEDASTNRSYSMSIPLTMVDSQECVVQLAQASFDSGADIPRPVALAAESKLLDIRAYLMNEASCEEPLMTVSGIGEEEQPNADELNPMIGMSPNLDEVVRLGKQMATMKTNQQLMEEGYIPDPIQ